jgi:phosphoglycolate phosphatase
MTLKAVIFDLDGTLTAFNLDYLTLRSEVRSFLIRTGIPASVLFVNESVFDMLNKTEIYLKNTGKSSRKIEKIRNEALAIAERHELEAAKTTELFPNVMETLETLKKNGLKIGLCTVSSEKSVNYILKRFRLANLFDAVIPRSKVKHVKPSGEHLAAVLKALKVSPRKAMLVGDAARDMQCAKELKVMAVGLSTGVSTPKDLMNAGANYLVTSIADLPNLIKTTKLIDKEKRRSIARLK